MFFIFDLFSCRIFQSDHSTELVSHIAHQTTIIKSKHKHKADISINSMDGMYFHRIVQVH